MDHLRKPLTVKVEDTEFSKRFEQPVQNYSPTSSDYSGKRSVLFGLYLLIILQIWLFRKGVSWSDADQSRARSYSPVGPPVSD
jgi:hypothetical protein